MKIIKRGVYCTKEMSEDFEKIASSLKQMSSWFWLMGLEGEEIDQDDWDKNIDGAIKEAYIYDQGHNELRVVDRRYKIN